MITSVATWRCKCGTTVTVITETNRSDSEIPARLKAACPKCGDSQTIYGHRIVTIKAAHPTGDQSPKPLD
jgi:5-methylcytosine-specific restriction endonuclease McrA